MNYYEKYLKYKSKYVQLRNQMRGGGDDDLVLPLLLPKNFAKQDTKILTSDEEKKYIKRENLTIDLFSSNNRNEVVVLNLTLRKKNENEKNYEIIAINHVFLEHKIIIDEKGKQHIEYILSKHLFKSNSGVTITIKDDIPIMFEEKEKKTSRFSLFKNIHKFIYRGDTKANTVDFKKND